ncbi:ubiquitin, putative [Entamoeba invadens IP1]|uniref:ubiquitin, putative n=1 Tax=Entamoeba invadens IP1 TaxID=370355 RepID=UPI0002C3E5DA|nr:ubiquitin, putative [Entamoeba invadens IP1]ELP90422.1 ubiquitin, putative [Entamoeba invadens IP1]|eukprot:XP_004257193.1 ubiquitin, putative [Entamoeba invadens IP1]
MLLIVRRLTGREFTIEAESCNTISDIKEKISKSEGLKVPEITIAYMGQQLEDTKTLTDYNIRPESKLYLVMRLRGGI